MPYQIKIIRERNFVLSLVLVGFNDGELAEAVNDVTRQTADMHPFVELADATRVRGFSGLSEYGLAFAGSLAYDYGGRVDRITTNSTLKRAISAFAATPLSVNVNQSDRVRGTVVDVYDSDFGRVSVLLNRWCDTGDVFGWDRDQAELCTLRPMQFEMLSKTGDSVYGQIVGEYTLKFRRERHAFRCSAVT